MRRSPLALALIAALLSGCGAADESTGATNGGSPPYFGDHPGQQATAQRISASDCGRLAKVATAQVQRPLQQSAEPTPPNSRCQLQGHGVDVSITLDAAYAARQRYENRMTEQVQFGAPDPSKLPHPVPDVGDPGAYNHYASWVPAYNTLYAVRGNRWLTIAYSAAGETRPRRLVAATALANLAFDLTAR